MSELRYPKKGGTKELPPKDPDKKGGTKELPPKDPDKKGGK